MSHGGIAQIGMGKVMTFYCRLCCMVFSVYMWIAAAGVVGGRAGRAPSVVCLSRVRGYICMCVFRVLVAWRLGSGSVP